MMAPMTTSSSTPEGEVTEDELIYYLVRSNGPGAVITACAYISSEGQGFRNGMGVSKDEHIESLKKLAQVIQLQGSKAIMQIYHAGRMARASYNGGIQPHSPSPIKAERDWAEIPKEISQTGVELLIKQFGDAVKRAIEAGFDGVELHGANTYLLQQFFSPNSNQRTDFWGGTLEKRMNFPLEVVKHCQEVIDKYAKKPFVLGYRISPEEREKPGIRIDDTLQFIDQLIEEDIDYLHLSVRYYYQPSLIGIGNYSKQIPRTIAERINGKVPLISVGKIISEKDARKTMEYADFISLGRQLIADPKWVQKMAEDNEKDITKEINPASQYELKIPNPLWNQIINIPNWFLVRKSFTNGQNME